MPQESDGSRPAPRQRSADEADEGSTPGNGESMDKELEADLASDGLADLNAGFPGSDPSAPEPADLLTRAVWKARRRRLKARDGLVVATDDLRNLVKKIEAERREAARKAEEQEARVLVKKSQATKVSVNDLGKLLDAMGGLSLEEAMKRLAGGGGADPAGAASPAGGDS
jgi:hypothetical protein